MLGVWKVLHINTLPDVKSAVQRHLGAEQILHFCRACSAQRGAPRAKDLPGADEQDQRFGRESGRYTGLLHTALQS